MAAMAAMAAGDMRCLEDAIAPAARKNLSNAEGESYPLGIWVSSWASGELTAKMAQILIEEKMGFHVRTGVGTGGSCSCVCCELGDKRGEMLVM